MSVRNPLSGVATRAARWSAVHPWRAILAWLAMVAVAVGLAMAVPTVETTDADYRLGESGRADQLVHESGLAAPPTENVLISSAGELDEADASSAAAELQRGLGATDGVVRVSAPQWSPDRSALLMEVQLAVDQTDPAPLTAVTESVAAEHPGLDVRQAGDLTLDAAIDERVEEDLRAAEGFSIPVTLVLMLLAFGAFIAAGIPVLLAVTSVAATIGISAPLSHLVPAEATVTSMIVLIGMAVGVDYSLFYLKREREERERGRTTLDAVEIAAETSGHSILVSGGAVIASMAGLYVVGDATFNSLATGAIVVVAVAVLGSITVLPALLATLGRWVDRPRVPLLWRLNRRIGRGGISRRVLAPVVRRPGVALLLAGLVVVALALPTLGMKLHSSTLQTLPQDLPEVQTFSRITEGFPVEGTAAVVVVRAGADDREEVTAALGELDESARATGDFVSTGGSAVAFSDDGTTATLRLAMPWDEADDRVDDGIVTLREELAPQALDPLGAEYAVGGGAAESFDFVAQQRGRLPLVIGSVLLLTLVMMGAAFRSVPVAVISTVLNLASVGVAFGILTLVFQHGWGASVLDFTSPGFVIVWHPPLRDGGPRGSLDGLPRVRP